MKYFAPVYSIRKWTPTAWLEPIFHAIRDWVGLTPANDVSVRLWRMAYR